MNVALTSDAETEGGRLLGLYEGAVLLQPGPGPHPGPHPHPELPQVKAAGFQGLCFDIEMSKGEMEVSARARGREVTLTLGEVRSP